LPASTIRLPRPQSRPKKKRGEEKKKKKRRKCVVAVFLSKRFFRFQETTGTGEARGKKSPCEGVPGKGTNLSGKRQKEGRRVCTPNTPGNFRLHEGDY